MILRAGDMLLKREILVEGDAQVADSRRKMNRGFIQIDRERERQAFLVVFRSNENHLSYQDSVEVYCCASMPLHQICTIVKS